MMVAEGSVDMCAEPELSLWDMAANAVIVQEAGGRFTGLDGCRGRTAATRRRPTGCSTTSSCTICALRTSPARKPGSRAHVARRNELRAPLPCWRVHVNMRNPRL
ncbi:inositol monophosphatase family protein [Streptomyces sp. M19]